MKEIFDKLKHSPIHNYILPGLTSWVLKTAGDGHGTIRMLSLAERLKNSSLRTVTDTACTVKCLLGGWRIPCGKTANF